jgi:hypothetical protein
MFMFELPKTKIVVVLLPEKVDTILVILDVIPELLGLGPVVNAEKGTPNTVVPDKLVVVSGDCLICLLFE